MLGLWEHPRGQCSGGSVLRRLSALIHSQHLGGSLEQNCSYVIQSTGKKKEIQAVMERFCAVRKDKQKRLNDEVEIQQLVKVRAIIFDKKRLVVHNHAVGMITASRASRAS